MENLSVLTGKYGDEGDQLIFKILNSGDYLKDVTTEQLAAGSKPLTKHIAEKALRYDLTVPFARYLAMNRHEVALPFKRYQMQPVWRADRPQKGRYREFYQCDADVAGTTSLICEAEIFGMIAEVFSALGIKDYTIKYNHRSVLKGISELIGAPGREADMCVAIDKLDKIGVEGVTKELQEFGFEQHSIDRLFKVLDAGTSITGLRSAFDAHQAPDALLLGLKDLEEILDYSTELNGELPALKFDASLARGLSYYTGAIFEVKINGVQIGSVSGGGRYDNLTGLFGWSGVPGVGFSFGVDRLYDCLTELDLFPQEVSQTTQVLISNFETGTIERAGLKLLTALRKHKLKAEIFPEPAKLKKQLGYADAKNIPFVVLIGQDELQEGVYTLKTMQTGEQEKLTLSALIERLIS